jgi:hypothetical protein
MSVNEEQMKASAPDWVSLPDEQLLDLRICDLKLRIPGTELNKCVRQLSRELQVQGLVFRPHIWLSDDWYSPDGVPGLAAPFYMGHPRLARLEMNQMLEVEGGTFDWCMRILRHETGHAIENAYHLRRRHSRQNSKSFVLHLDMWYAQSHPDEDFAETFAVWLTPGSHWRERYIGWPALKKLEYMDGLMKELVGVPPTVTKKERVDPIGRLKKTLREHYQSKRERYGLDYPNFYARDLRRLFSGDPEKADHPPAATFIRKFRKEVRRKVAEWTGEYQYTIDQVLQDMITHCRQNNLRLAISEDRAKVDFTILLTVQTMNYLHGGRHRMVL